VPARKHRLGDAPNIISDPVHALYTGVTQSGKTTLARLHARALSRMEHNVIVYDPVGSGTLGGDWPEDAVRFDDPNKLMIYLEKEDVADAHVFIDEADTVLGHVWTENHWLLTRGRHKGLYIRVITQRPKMVSPSVRAQCSICYHFRLAKKDATEIQADFGHDANTLATGLGGTAQEGGGEGDPGTGTESLDAGDFFVLYSGHAAIERANVYDILNSRSHRLNKVIKHKDE
jgi:hypothetical protein